MEYRFDGSGSPMHNYKAPNFVQEYNSSHAYTLSQAHTHTLTPSLNHTRARARTHARTHTHTHTHIKILEERIKITYKGNCVELKNMNGAERQKPTTYNGNSEVGFEITPAFARRDGKRTNS